MSKYLLKLEFHWGAMLCSILGKENFAVGRIEWPREPHVPRGPQIFTPVANGLMASITEMFH